MNEQVIDEFEYLKFYLGHKGLEMYLQKKNLEEKSFAIIDKVKSLCYVFRKDKEFLQITYFNKMLSIHNDLLDTIRIMWGEKINVLRYGESAEKLLSFYMG